MKTIFNSVKVTTPDSNTFDLTHDVKMSGKMGDIMPILCMEIMPGDKVTMACDVFARFAPLISPVMHRFDVKTEYYFVPNRLTWANWEKFIDQETTGGIPTLSMSGAWTAAQLKLADYLGVPPWGSTTGGTATPINALPFAAYQAIYNEWYRDQNLVTAINYQLADGPNALGIFATMRKRAWEHDYFTAALPFAQKGAAVSLPLGAVDITLDPTWTAAGSTPVFRQDDGTSTTGPLGNVSGAGAGVYVGLDPDKNAYDPDGTLIGSVGATTINELRSAYSLQRFLEKMARGGTRYIEMIKVMFGVKSSDSRLQRPEYITGNKQAVVISEVLQTSETVATTPQGNMSGHGVAVGDGYVDTFTAEEHGYIIGVMSVMPKPAYQQGIPKTFLKTDPLDWPWPEFAHLGEQAIENQELYAYTTTREDTFGYIPRYAEFKYMPSRVAGDFRNSGLDSWHAGRLFAAQPTLSQAFIEMDWEEIDRIFAVQDGTDNLWIHVLNKIKARRKLPVFGTPNL